MSRRRMIQLSGLSVAGSLISASSFSKESLKNNFFSGKLKIIIAGAHPDDPESGAGGTMALLSAEGHEVVSAYLTRGEAGINGKTYEEAARIRTSEAKNACRILNARAEFLGQIDGSTEITKEQYEVVRKFIEKENPDIVFTHWPVDSHRDHRICSILIYDAWLTLGKRFPLYYFEVETGIQSQNFQPSNYIDITTVIKQKTDACMAHSSQNPEDWYLNLHKKMEHFRGLEINCEFAEAFVGLNQNKGTLIPV